MMNDNNAMARRAKSREVSSRFLSSNSATSSLEIVALTSPLSPTHRKCRTTSSDNTRKLRSQESPLFGLWPSSSSSTNRLDTLADHFGNERLKDPIKSSTDFSRLKENDRTITAGSMRYSEKLNSQGKIVTSSSLKLPIQTSESGGLSADGNTLLGRLLRRRSENFKNSIEIESLCSEKSSSPKTSTINSQKSGTVVSSKYMNDIQRRPKGGGASNSNSLDSFPLLKKKPIKNTIQRANSLSGHGSSTTRWALSPGRSGSPPMTVESREKPMSFSTLKPITTHSKALLNLGLDLFKSKKNSRATLSPTGPGISDNVHQFRMLHNRLVQWQFVNAKADVVSENLANSAEINLVSGWSSIAKLQRSVLQKKLQLQKEKLQFKLNFILLSQLKPLEIWGDMERQHLTALSMTKECLHSVICRVPLIEGAKIDAQTISMALRHASDLAISIKSILTIFAPRANETTSLLSELAKVVAQERLLLEECLELHQIISTLEIEERSLKCGIVQMTLQNTSPTPAI